MGTTESSFYDELFKQAVGINLTCKLASTDNGNKLMYTYNKLIHIMWHALIRIQNHHWNVLLQPYLGNCVGINSFTELIHEWGTTESSFCDELFKQAVGISFGIYQNL